MNSLRLILVLMLFGVAGAFGVSAEFGTYALLKQIDIPEYDEWRLSFNVDTYTWDNFGWGMGGPQQTNWHESLYSLSLEFGFWTFGKGDLNLGARLPYYFWYAKDDLRDDNQGTPGAKTSNTGMMDPEIFGDFKIDLTDHISGMAHVGANIPGFAEAAVDGGTALGVMRITALGGVLIEYNRFVAKIMLGIELGSTPDVQTSYRTPALLVPQVSSYDNSNVMILNIDTVFCASATTGFGIEYIYKGTYFAGGAWSAEFAGEPDPLGMLIIKLYFSSASGGFVSSESGTIITVGIGMGGIGGDPDLNPDILYRISASKYF